MSATDPRPSHEIHLPKPVLREPEALVENIYALPGTGTMPDPESQDVMGAYLIDRFAPQNDVETRVVMTPTGLNIPHLPRRVPAGYKEVGRLRKTDEWLISPRQALAVTVGSMALFNIIGNHDTLNGSAAATSHAIYRVFNPVHDTVSYTHKTVRKPGLPSEIHSTATTSDRVGATDVDPIAIKQFITNVTQVERRGGEITSLRVVGNVSDEWSNDATIGAADSQNQRLAKARATAAVEALAADGLKVPASHLKTDVNEHVVSQPEKAALAQEAKTDGYATISDALRAADHGKTVPASLATKLKKLFTNKQERGVSLSATINYPGKDVYTQEKIKHVVKGHDNAPNVPKPNWYWFIPLLPIRRRERYNTVKELKRWEFTPSTPIMRPQYIRKDAEQAWVRIRPEAMKEDGSLVDNPWVYTRKYEHLLRDDRIVDVLRADFKNSRGEDKSLRIMFVDVSPADQTIEQFEGLLKKFAAMEDGKLGNRVSGIFVYPTENTGVVHNDPKRIAMGVDQQYPEELLGTFTYALDLVELHMPATWDSTQLDELFTTFNGPAWVTAHEVAGHGTDESDEQLRLRRVLARGIPQAHVIDGDPRAQKMRALNGVLSRLPRRQRDTTPLQFDISYPVIDNDGQTVTLQARVLGDDPRLAHATHSTIVGYQPTRYSSTNPSEHYAETAASVTTGIAVPYDEADIAVAGLRADNGEKATFATGYRPDKRGQQAFTMSVGAQGSSFPVEFIDAPDVKISHINPANDKLLRRELIRTRGLRTLYPNQMIAILARVTQQARSAKAKA